jgi:hypothetical protein
MEATVPMDVPTIRRVNGISKIKKIINGMDRAAFTIAPSTPFGNLTLELIGKPALLDEALDYLHGQGLEIEVLKNA